MSYNNQLYKSPNAYNSIYDVRMNEFYHNYLSNTKSNDSVNDLPMPPKLPLNFGLDDSCWSGINQNLNLSQINKNSPYMTRTHNHSASMYQQQDSGIFNSLQLNDTSSPYLLNRTKPVINKNLQIKPELQFQSTPNKTTNQKFLQVPSILINNKKANFHSIDDLAKSSSDSFNNTGNNNDQSSGYSSSSHEIFNVTNQNKAISFNENLKQFTQFKLENKENNEFIYKTKRRPRAQINKQQRDILEYAYKTKCYPDSNEIEYLCSVLGHEENVIRIWFQNKRARNKTSRKPYEQIE